MHFSRSAYGSLPGNSHCPLPGDVYGSLPGNICSPCLGRLPVPCLGTLASSLPGNACQSLPGTLAGALPGHAYRFPAWERFASFFFFLRTFSSLICHGPSMPCMYVLAKNVMPEARQKQEQLNQTVQQEGHAWGDKEESRKKWEKRSWERTHHKREREWGEGCLLWLRWQDQSKIEGCWCGACVVHASCM